MKLSLSNDSSSRLRFAKARVHPLLFIGLLMLIFLAPSVVTAFSGSKIPTPQLPSHSFPIIKR